MREEKAKVKKDGRSFPEGQARRKWKRKREKEGKREIERRPWDRLVVVYVVVGEKYVKLRPTKITVQGSIESIDMITKLCTCHVCVIHHMMLVFGASLFTVSPSRKT